MQAAYERKSVQTLLRKFMTVVAGDTRLGLYRTSSNLLNLFDLGAGEGVESVPSEEGGYYDGLLEVLNAADETVALLCHYEGQWVRGE